MKKRAMTLLEIMIVIFLIGVVGSIVGVNIKKSLEKTKIYQTKVQIQKIEDALMMAMAEDNKTAEEICLNQDTVLDVLKNSYLFRDQAQKNPETMIKDGWGETLSFQPNNNEIKVISEHLSRLEIEQSALKNSKKTKSAPLKLVEKSDS
jgi:prepilin-type N-terminal cleavage/methylation domain-containing protein